MSGWKKVRRAVEQVLGVMDLTLLLSVTRGKRSILLIDDGIFWGAAPNNRGGAYIQNYPDLGRIFPLYFHFKHYNVELLLIDTLALISQYVDQISLYPNGIFLLHQALSINSYRR